jgi:hypothetical protein
MQDAALGAAQGIGLSSSNISGGSGEATPGHYCEVTVSWSWQPMVGLGIFPAHDFVAVSRQYFN